MINTRRLASIAFILLNDKEMQRTHAVTILPGQKPFPQAHMQYREHLHQLGRAVPRLRPIIMQIQQKTGLACLEPEYTVGRRCTAQ
jgi:hypothetical protein